MFKGLHFLTGILTFFLFGLVLRIFMDWIMINIFSLGRIFKVKAFWIKICCEDFILLVQKCRKSHCTPSHAQHHFISIFKILKIYVKILLFLFSLTVVLLSPDIPCLYKQCRSRSVGLKKPTDLDLHYLPLSIWICINKLDQVIRLAKNWKHLNLFSRTSVNIVWIHE